MDGGRRTFPWGALGALVALGALGCAASGEQVGGMGCGPNPPDAVGHRWVLDAVGPASVRVWVDTVASTTSFDPAMRVFVLPPPEASRQSPFELGDFFDEVSCSHNCGPFFCPEAEVELFHGEGLRIDVRRASLLDCRESTAPPGLRPRCARYEVRAEVDGEPISVTRVVE